MGIREGEVTLPENLSLDVAEDSGDGDGDTDVDADVGDVNDNNDTAVEVAAVAAVVEEVEVVVDPAVESVALMLVPTAAS